jgi:hypothetical protein
VEYARILKDYFDVFAWTPTDLEGIPAELGEHAIDLQEGAVPVRQRQYRLNPRYSLMVKGEIDRLLEAGFIYLSQHRIEYFPTMFQILL